MEHANVRLLRDAYAAFAAGDMRGFLAFCATGVTFRFPGNGLLGGRHSTSDFFAKLTPAMDAIGGSLHEEPLHYAADADHGFVVVAQLADRDGETHTWTCVHLWRIVEGKLAEFREFIDDPITYDAAWHK
jgi:ketosteroid isomerase-like protein